MKDLSNLEFFFYNITGYIDSDAKNYLSISESKISENKESFAKVLENELNTNNLSEKNLIKVFDNKETIERVFTPHVAHNFLKSYHDFNHSTNFFFHDLSSKQYDSLINQKDYSTDNILGKIEKSYLMIDLILATSLYFNIDFKRNDDSNFLDSGKFNIFFEVLQRTSEEYFSDESDSLLDDSNNLYIDKNDEFVIAYACAWFKEALNIHEYNLDKILR